MRFVLQIVLVVLGIFGSHAFAADAVSPGAPGKASLVTPVALRGTLGDARVQVNLRAKADYAEGVEGEYFFFGRSHNVLLAGELAGDDLLMEESENGTDVSGLWTGTLAGETVSGEWESADGKVRKPFNLTILKTEVVPRSASSLKTEHPNKSSR